MSLGQWIQQVTLGYVMYDLTGSSVLLGLLSGAVGIFVAFAGLQVLFGTLPGAANFVTPKLNATVFLFALIVSRYESSPVYTHRIAPVRRNHE